MKKISILMSVFFVFIVITYILLGYKLDKIAEENIRKDISETSFIKTSDKFNQILWNEYTGTNNPKMDNEGIIQYII